MMTRRVVAGVDGSEQSLAAARWAAEEAVLRGSPLRLVHAAPLEPHMLPTAHGPGGWQGAAARMLDRAVSRIARARPGLHVDSRLVADTPAAALAGAEPTAELLVLGTRGLGGFRELRVGSVALGTAGRASCPVALVPAGTPAHHARDGSARDRSDHNGSALDGSARDEPAEGRRPEIVVGIDARHPDDSALDLAFDMAGRRGALLHAVHAWSLPSQHRSPWAPYVVTEEDRAGWEDQEGQLLDDALRGWREKYPTVPVLADVRLFGPAEALVKLSAGADAVIVGRGAAPDGCMSAVAHALVHHARCPVVLVPHG